MLYVLLRYLAKYMALFWLGGQWPGFFAPTFVSLTGSSLPPNKCYVIAVVYSRIFAILSLHWQFAMIHWIYPNWLLSSLLLAAAFCLANAGLQCFDVCWLGGMKSIRPVKNMEWWGAGMVVCLERGANDLHMVQLMPLPPRHLLLQQNPEWFILLVPAYPGCPGKRPLNVCVCVLRRFKPD